MHPNRKGNLLTMLFHFSATCFLLTVFLTLSSMTDEQTTDPPIPSTHTQLPPNDAYLIFTAALLQAFNFSLNVKHLRDNARPRLEQCIEWLRVRFLSLLRMWRDEMLIGDVHLYL